MKIDITETSHKFENAPSMSEAQRFEEVTGQPVDFGHYASSGKIHKNLENETEEERLANPY